MKLIIIRHGDPDYSIDSLTPQGKVEAELLSQMMCRMDVKQFYVSTMGRAKDTAKYTLEKLGRAAVECEWLREFSPSIKRPDGLGSVPWDWRPKDWTPINEFYDLDKWGEVPVMAEGGVQQEYQRIVSEFDKLLASHGYVRNGRTYAAVNANEDTLVFFCHFALECVLISHLLGISPVLLWHGLCSAPTGVSTLVTEEREKGIAYFRMLAFGDTSHLYIGGESPSFAARFCETYDNFEQRHD